MQTTTLNGFAFSELPEAPGLYRMIDPVTSLERLVAVGRDGAHVIDVDDEFLGYKPSALNNPAIFVGGLTIEIDVASAFSADHQYVAYGSITRRAERASLHVRSIDSRNMPFTYKLDLATGLPAAPSGSTVAFSRWTLGWGTGDDRKVLRAFDIPLAQGHVR
jgi:hypothetical protein